MSDTTGWESHDEHRLEDREPTDIDLEEGPQWGPGRAPHERVPEEGASAKRPGASPGLEKEEHDEEGARLFAGYSANQRPLYGYAELLAAYGAIFVGFLAAARATGRPLPRRIDLRDVMLLGMATHRLSRLVSRERIAAPIRAPFTHLEGRGEGPNEVRERARGRGLRRSIGELLTCPFCTGVWTASFLSYGFVMAPGATRVVAGIFAADAVSDFLHLAYGKLKK
jgi:hypothetical protein